MKTWLWSAVIWAGISLAQAVYPTAHGILKSISGSELVLQVEEDHEIKFRIIRKTRIVAQGKNIKASDLKPGQMLDIDMQSSLDGSFEAVTITVDSPKSPKP